MTSLARLVDPENFAAVVFTLLSAGLLGYDGVVLISAIRRRLNRQLTIGLHPDEIDLVHRHAEELDQLRRELGELHERVDFTERLLAGHGDAAAIKAPESPT